MTDKLATTVLLLAALLTGWPLYRLLQEPSARDARRDLSVELQELERTESELAPLLADPASKAEQSRRVFVQLRETLESLVDVGGTPADDDTDPARNYARELDVAQQVVADHMLARAEVRTAIKDFEKAWRRVMESELPDEARSELNRAGAELLVSGLEGAGALDAERANAFLGRVQWFAQQESESRVYAPLIEATQALESSKTSWATTLADVEFDRLARVRRDWRAQLEESTTASTSIDGQTRTLAAWALLGLLATLTLAVARMRKVAKAMRATQANLEQRVKERTDQLVKTNQDLRDQMSERRKAELDTRAARKQAEVASQTKSEFLANMSHEIRTPMTAILGFSERLLDPTASESERQEAVATIRRNGSYLLQIINDILDLSKIEAGKLQIERITMPTVDIARGVLELLAPRADEKGLTLSVEYLGPIPQFIETDTVRLRQILLNLVGNAIKFTHNGGVVIRIECVDEPFELIDRAGNQFTGVKPFLKCSVIDTGIGMTEEQLSALFRPFTQADNSTTRNFGGTGLGLSISKSLCALLGGRIEVTSRPGQGSRFTFTVDPGRLEGIDFIEPQSENVISVPELPKRKDELRVDRECRVLLAEDGLDNQRLIRYLLERAGVTVSIVSNGEQAVNHALAGWKEGDPFDVILMDMQMPVMDGYSAVQTLRSSGYDQPIVALTAHAMATDRQKCLSIGCDAFCPKPIDKRELISILNQFTKTARPAPSGLNEPVEEPLDDDPEMLELIAQFVEDLQADVVALRAAAAKGDLDKIATLAHQLKGCAGGYGFPSLGEVAGRVESLARDGSDEAGLRSELESLVRGCQALKGR